MALRIYLGKKEWHKYPSEFNVSLPFFAQIACFRKIDFK